MKKIIISLLTCVLSICSAPTNIVGKNYDNLTIRKEIGQNPYEKKTIIYDNGKTTIVIVNHLTGDASIDGIALEKKVVHLPLPRTTVDYSTALSVQYKIPWKGSIAATSTIIMALYTNIYTTTAVAIANFVAAEKYDVWVSAIQYNSKEDYYSSCYNTYYKKSIYRNITAYKNFVSKQNVIYGPKHGSWFDPIRPE